MLTRACGLLPCTIPPSWGHSHPSCRAPVRYVNGSNLFQLLTSGREPQAELAGEAGSPWGGEHREDQREHAACKLARGCQGPLEALFEQPFISSSEAVGDQTCVARRLDLAE